MATEVNERFFCNVDDMEQTQIMKESTYDIDNYFAVSNPHLCSCAVMSYAIGHSEMLVKIEDETHKEFYIVFYYVEYYSGPLKWKGANFSTQSKENTMKLLYKIKPEINNKIPESSLANFHLYTVNTPDFEVCILAAGAENINQ
jgi:hypothetical protein